MSWAEQQIGLIAMGWALRRSRMTLLRPLCMVMGVPVVEETLLPSEGRMRDDET